MRKTILRMRKTIDISHTGPGGSVRVSTWDNDKAATVAGILARREYGRRGTCRTLRLDSWARDGTAYNYEAFIGTRNNDGSVSGRNVWIYV